jgi:arabinan endo-1,5-alpha-L-arabinosidase
MSPRRTPRKTALRLAALLTTAALAGSGMIAAAATVSSADPGPKHHGKHAKKHAAEKHAAQKHAGKKQHASLKKTKGKKDGKGKSRKAQLRRAGKALYGAQPLATRNVPDPTVVRYDGGFVALGTGQMVARVTAPTVEGPWTATAPALASLPSWAAGPSMWAPDVLKIGDQWVMYFSALTRGLKAEGRCIGVATAATPTDAFVPQERPVVCPDRSGTNAYDGLKGAPQAMRKGVIDPDVFRDKKSGRLFLLYRTQGTPSTIRMVRLPSSGVPGTTKRRQNVELIRNEGVVENPAMIQRGGKYVLFTSEGSFARCGYETTWRRSNDLRDWSKARPKLLTDTASTGMCGPGGADLVQAGKKKYVMYFHAWMCPDVGTNANCPIDATNYDETRAYSARRSLYGANLTWTKRQSPRLQSYIVPVYPTVPTPTATATVTTSPTPSGTPTTPTPGTPTVTVTTS